MTTLEEDVAVELEAPSPEVETGTKSRKRDVDFTKVNGRHEELAAYINAHSGLEPVTAHQVKAIIVLRSDFAATPEQVSKRAEAKERRAAANARFAGMSPEQVAVEKAAERAEKQAEKLREKLEEQIAKAARIRSGDDVASAVEADQGQGEGRKIRRK